MAGERTQLGQAFESLPHDERAARYRQFATDALLLASLAKDGELRAGYLGMAAGWHALASEMEKAGSPPPAAQGEDKKAPELGGGKPH